MTEKTEIATTSTETVPAYLESQGAGGAVLDDNFGAEDMILPRVTLLQGTSDATKQFPNAQPGMFWHTGMDREIDPMRFVICQRRKRVALLAPPEDGRRVLARADDATKWDTLGSWDVVVDRKTGRSVKWTIDTLDVNASGLLRWGTSDPDFRSSPPAATMFYDYVCMFPEQPLLGMALMSLSRSALKRAKQGLNDKIALQASNGRPMQSLVFQASATMDKGELGDFFNWRFTSAGFAPEEIYKRAMAASNVMDTALPSYEEPTPAPRLSTDDMAPPFE